MDETTFPKIELEALDILDQTHPLLASTGFQPDEDKAYLSVRICRAFPNVIGPESVAGAYFGFHPAVLANSRGSLIHKWINLEHKMIAHGTSTRDHLLGTILAVDFPEPESEDGSWSVPENPDAAPSYTFLAVVHKQAAGAASMLAEHASGKKKWSASIEPISAWRDTGVYRASDRSIHPLTNLPGDLRGQVREHKEHGYTLHQPGGRERLAWALGGASGQVRFQGVGMTKTPAERAAAVTSMHAEIDGKKVLRLAASRAPQWLPGQPVKWTQLASRDAGQGIVLRAAESGLHRRGHEILEGSEDNPVLLLRLPDGRTALRTAASVRAA